MIWYALINEPKEGGFFNPSVFETLKSSKLSKVKYCFSFFNFWSKGDKVELVKYFQITFNVKLSNW